MYFHKNNVFLLVFVWSFVGCSSFSENISNEKNVILLAPETLDFGNVRIENFPITMKFSIINNSDSSLEIFDVHSSCGCSVLEMPTRSISSHDFCVIPVKVNFPGHFGIFTNHIFIKTSQTAKPLLITLSGNIVYDIWLSNKTLHCIIENRGSNQATGIFEIRTIDYPDIVFEESAYGEGMIVQELSRENIGGETVIKFRLTVTTFPCGNWMVPLHLVPKNHSLNPLVLNVKCYHGDSGLLMAPIRTTQIHLSQMKPGEKRFFFIEGEANVLGNVSEIFLINAPEALSIEMAKEREEGVLSLTLSLDAHANPGIIGGQVVIKTTGNDIYYLPLFGRIQ